MLDVVINGEPKDIEAGTTVADLIKGLRLSRGMSPSSETGISSRAQSTRRAFWKRGDRLEIVTLVGGG